MPSFGRLGSLRVTFTKNATEPRLYGEVCHVERWINTLRQRLSRFVRKTLSFSKSHHMHHCCLKLFIYLYNLERRSIILG